MEIFYDSECVFRAWLWCYLTSSRNIALQSSLVWVAVANSAQSSGLGPDWGWAGSSEDRQFSAVQS